MPSRNPLGMYSPWAWEIEPVHGCNLRCGHCAARLLKTKPNQMSLQTWANLMGVIQSVKPRVRVELAMCGEPTLHDDLPLLLSTGRRLCPEAQFQITTNGTQIAAGRWTYRELFAAGANILYVDMYAPREKHIALAEASGFQWYEYLDPPEDAPSAWSYHGPDLKMIVLMEHPANWPEERKKKLRLGTWLNNLDWKAAEEFGLYPVTTPIDKSCLQPMRHVAVDWQGYYLLCCQDFMGETAGTMGSVNDGPEGFLPFWFGEKMQRTRRALMAKRRCDVPECSKCNVRFSTRMSRSWSEEMLAKWWDGKTWKPL